MIKRMKMFLWIVVGLLLLACGGCSRPAPAHLTAAEMAEIRSWVKACVPPSGKYDDMSDEDVDQLVSRFESIVQAKAVRVEDICYALRMCESSGNDFGEYAVTFWLINNPLIGVRFVYDRHSGIITRVMADYVKE